jgi:hypothetical protein
MAQRSQDLASGKFVLRENAPYHEKMSLLIALLLALSAHADDTWDVQRETPVYQKSAADSRVSFVLQKGEKAYTAPSKNEDFWRLRVQRKGRWFQGYVRREDVAGPLNLPAIEHPRGDWGLGAGAEYTSLLQKGRSFQTDDQVQWATSDYKSLSAGPFFVTQWHYVDFWRLTLAVKKAHYSATATANVVGAQVKTIDVQQTFYSVLLQKAWMPLQRKNFYYGIGAEIAKAQSDTAKLGDSNLTTTTADYPTYFGPMIFWGGSLSLNQSISMYLEGRFEYIANQSPGIYGLEVALGLLYWP